MKDILDKLRGGDLRSTGNADAVAEEIANTNNPELFEVVFNGLYHDDPVVRMRSADAVEKAAPFKSQLTVNSFQETSGGVYYWIQHRDFRDTSTSTTSGGKAMKFTRRPDLDPQTRIHIVLSCWRGSIKASSDRGERISGLTSCCS